jgi:putative oxidoreductase
MMKVPEQIQDGYRRLSDLKEARLTRDVALLGARVALAWVFVYHGAATLFGAFGGPGVHRASIFYGTVAHLHPATFFTVFGGSIEFFGGIAVGLGLFGRLAGLGLAGDMAAAMITVTFANGIASTALGGGYELNLALAGLAFVVALLGTGRFSLDFGLRLWWERTRSSQPKAAGEVRYDERPDRIPAS